MSGLIACLLRLSAQGASCLPSPGQVNASITSIDDALGIATFVSVPAGRSAAKPTDRREIVFVFGTQADTALASSLCLAWARQTTAPSGLAIPQ
jgi:hypothetical protein